MKKYFGLIIWMLIIGSILMIAFSSYASDSREKTKNGESTGESNKSLSQMFVYKPPMRGRPGNREGGGTRGSESNVIYLAALVPDHPGLTIQAQPSLYWYLSKPTIKLIEFTLNDEQGIKPLLEISLNVTDQHGIQCLRLSDYNLHLSHGVEYQWFVALVPDADSRSNDIVVGGTIKRIEPSKTLTERLAKADKMKAPEIYAGEGIWYDAFSAISELIEANPNNLDLRQQRALLLEQVGLSEVADYERKEP